VSSKDMILATLKAIYIFLESREEESIQKAVKYSKAYYYMNNQPKYFHSENIFNNAKFLKNDLTHNLVHPNNQSSLCFSSTTIFIGRARI
jgi:hypothetical protein